MTKDTKQTLIGLGVLVALGFYLMHKKRRILEGSEESGFQNATGCSSSQLAEAMTHCESMAQAGETTTVKKCKIRNNGNRHVTCQYTNANGGIRYRDAFIGTEKMRRRTR